MGKNIDSAAFRRIMGCFATGIAVITTQDAEFGAVGLTVNSMTSVSLDPPLILFCLDKKAALHQVFRRTEIYAFNLLAEGQEDISRHFADRHHNPNHEDLWDKPQDTCPILHGTLGWVLCRAYAFHEGGDHTIFVGEAIAEHRKEHEMSPLLYFQGRYRGIKA